MLIFETNNGSFKSVTLPRVIVEENEVTSDVLGKLNAEQKASLGEFLFEDKLT